MGRGEAKMKRRHYMLIALCVMAISMTLWATLPSDEDRPTTREFIIRVTGTEGLPADGIVTVVDKNRTKDEAFTVKVPWEKRITADSVNAGFQKLSPDGLLKIQLLDDDGNIIHESETTLKYGVVFVMSDKPDIQPK